MPEQTEKLKAKTLVCPFTGEQIEIVHNDRLNMYMAKGPFWATKWFDFEEDLLYKLSHRVGKEPMLSPRSRVQVIGVKEPPEAHPGEDLGGIPDIGDEAIERIFDNK